MADNDGARSYDCPHGYAPWLCAQCWQAERERLEAHIRRQQARIDALERELRIREEVGNG